RPGAGRRVPGPRRAARGGRGEDRGRARRPTGRTFRPRRLLLRGPRQGRCGDAPEHDVQRGIGVTFTTRPELSGRFGMVASTHWLASGTGMAVLEAGGNAFDAAVAAGFVLQVVEPHLNGPGGELPIVLYAAERDEVLVVSGQGTAPVAATIDAYRERGLELI